MTKKESILPEEYNRRDVGHQDYYWILPYVKRLKLFFVSDLEQAFKKDDFYFTNARLLQGIQYWINNGCIKVLPTNYVQAFGGKSVNKYVYVKDPE